MPGIHKTTIVKRLRDRAEECERENYHTACAMLNKIADGINNGTLKTATDVAQLVLKHSQDL